MRGSLRIYVVSVPDGSPVRDATVALVAVRTNEPFRSAISDPFGSVVFSDLAHGRWQLRAAASGTDAATSMIEVLDDAMTEITIELTVSRTQSREVVKQEVGLEMRPSRLQWDEPMEAGGSVRGRAEDSETGNVVPEATVMIDSGPSSAPDIAFVTDSAGTFFFGELGPGDWVFRVIAPDGREGRSAVKVTPGETSQLTVQLKHLHENA